MLFFFLQLPIHIPRESLPTTLGGTLEIDHDAWLRHCRLSTSTLNWQNGPPPDIMAGMCHDVKHLNDKVVAAVVFLFVSLVWVPMLQPSRLLQAALTFVGLLIWSSYKLFQVMQMKETTEDISNEKKDEPSPEKHPRLCHYPISGEDNDEEISKTLGGNVNWTRRESNSGCNPSPPPPPSSASSGFSDDDSLHCDVNSPAFSIEQFVDHVRLKGRKGLMTEYMEIRQRPPDGSFNIAR